MKFVCEQQKLAKALNIVSKAVTSRTTVPILKGIMMDVSEDGILTMSASDLDISIKHTLEVEEAEAGCVIIPAKLFDDIIRKLPSREIRIESDAEYNMIIRCMNSKFNILGMSPDEFPVIQSMTDSSNAIEFNKKELRSMIERTAFAASVEEARGIITGVLIELKEEEMNMVAIDGYRMAINRIPHATAEEKKLVISAKLLSEMSRILNEIDDEEETGKLFLGEKKAVFQFSNLQADLKLMEGEFIRYQDILPKSSNITITINRLELKESIERASLLTRAAKNHLIRMNIEDNKVTITSNSDEGDVKEEIDVQQDGDNLVIGFNAQYILDVLKQLADDEVKMLFNTAITPCLIQPLEGNDFEYLVLPVRIN